MSNETQTVTVSHLGSSIIGYKFGRSYHPDLPTLVMVNSYTTSVELYLPQFADAELNPAVNLLALEPYGHGRTRATYPHFTYWDSAIANLQVLEALGIREAIVLGTSQGGWVPPHGAAGAGRGEGRHTLGTSMDFESPRSRDLAAGTGSSSTRRRSMPSPTRSARTGWYRTSWSTRCSEAWRRLDEERDFWLATYRELHR